ncbi:MAG: hypothetical protein ACREXP_20340 [Steroidobacteraceae bacterium]
MNDALILFGAAVVAVLLTMLGLRESAANAALAKNAAQRQPHFDESRLLIGELEKVLDGSGLPPCFSQFPGLRLLHLPRS